MNRRSLGHVSRSAAMAAAVTLVLARAMAGPAGAAQMSRAVSFTTEDGVAIAGQLYESAQRPAPAVVLIHMLGRTHGDWDNVARVLQAAGLTALAIDLRGHGLSGGSGDVSADMVGDVRAAVAWLAAQPDVRPDAIGVAGASLGANLALLAAAGDPGVRAVATVSPSLDYRGVRVGTDVMRRLSGRHVWMAASTEDPLALRTIKGLTVDNVAIDQQLSGETAHGSQLLTADPGLAGALVDWLHQRLIF